MHKKYLNPARNDLHQWLIIHKLPRSTPLFVWAIAWTPALVLAYLRVPFPVVLLLAVGGGVGLWLLVRKDPAVALAIAELGINTELKTTIDQVVEDDGANEVEPEFPTDDNEELLASDSVAGIESEPIVDISSNSWESEDHYQDPEDTFLVESRNSTTEENRMSDDDALDLYANLSLKRS